MTCRTWPKSPQSPLHHTRSRCRTSSSEQCTNVLSCVRTRRRNLPSSVRVWESVVTTSCEYTATQSLRSSELQTSTTRTAVSRKAPPGFGGQHHATLSAAQRGIGYKRAGDIAPAHLGAFIAAKPRIQAMIHDGVTVGLLPKQPLETRLAAVIETAISTYLDALDDEDKPTAKLYVQKAAQAADEAWQQTIGGLQGPGVTNPTVSALEDPSSASQHEDSEGMDFSAHRKSRLSAPQLQAQLSWLTERTRLWRLKSTLFSKGAWQQVTRIEDLCHTHVSHKWLYHLDACAGSVLHRSCPRTQRRPGCVCHLLPCSSSPRRRRAGVISSQTITLQRRSLGFA